MSKQPLFSCSRAIRNQHRGAVLIVALIMLLVLTTLGVSTITSTNINLQLLQSQQRQQEAQQAAQNSINYLLSDLDYYINNASYLDGDGDFTLSFPSNVSSGMVVTVNSLQCLLQATPAGCSLLEGSSAPCHPEYYWEADVSVTDNVSGASSTIIEGFKFRYLEGYCPV
ncbi:pilus assembly PilX N-terminal domain-containing protein [Porticoccaceae bacterium]|mgnify:CR=1 FL=1|nr:pilus assembly PilX N-terminal domain-containing protein [Porticoccaceae bacterium]